MRRGQFIIIFGIIFATLLLSVAIRQYRNRVVIDERARLEDAFLDASDTAAEELALGFSSNIENTLANTADLFFSSLGASLNLYNDEDAEKEAWMYVPVLVVTLEDGFYLNILERASVGGERLIIRRWTECLPYCFSDDKYVYRFTTNGSVSVYDTVMGRTYTVTYAEVSGDPVLSAQFRDSEVFDSVENFETIKAASIVNSIEKQVRLVLAEEAYIANDLGLNVSYSCPSFVEVLPENWAGCFLAVYQGLPSRADTAYSYSGVRAASFVREKTFYLVAEPEEGEYYRLAHREGCTHLKGDETEHVERTDAIHVYGAYGCPDCILPVEGFMYPPN